MPSRRIQLLVYSNRQVLKNNAGWTRMEASMKELVEVIASALVDSPKEVVVTETETDKEIVLSLKVAPDDMGKVIGKQGRIAKAIRTVVRAAGSRGDKKIMVDIQ